jgi:hypothetical protein
MPIDWDPAKAEANRRKHGVDFADAVAVLSDPFALSREDIRAVGEQRFVAIGMDRLGRGSGSSRPAARPETSEESMSADVPDNDDMAAEYDFRGARQGPILPPRPHATTIWLCVDNDLLDWYRAQVHAQGGGDYGELMHEALRLYRAYAESIQARQRKAEAHR